MSVPDREAGEDRVFRALTVAVDDFQKILLQTFVDNFFFDLSIPYVHVV